MADDPAGRASFDAAAALVDGRRLSPTLPASTALLVTGLPTGRRHDDGTAAHPEELPAYPSHAGASDEALSDATNIQSIDPQRRWNTMTRSTIEKATIGFGLVYLLVGILGFLPGITIPAAHHGPAPGAGLLLGIFAVNLIHNLAHLLVGAALVWGGLKAERAITVNRVMAGVFLFLVVASLIAPVVEGVAINPPDTILHLASALLTGYLGFGARWAAAVSRS